MPDTDIIRVIRVLEYVGERSAVENTLSRNGVKGIYVTPNMTIREAILGPFPETLEKGGE